MNCHACKAIVPDGGKFCPECGATTNQMAPCSHCGEQNPTNATFCTGCGKSVKANTQSVSNGTQDSETDFVYLLSEEKMRAVSTSSVRIPYGCFAVTLVNGVVHEFQNKITAGNSEPSVITDFFKSVSEFARGLIGQKNNEVKTFIVSNCQGLPLITYMHPVKIMGVNNANLRFDFWLENNAGETGAVDAPIGIFMQRVLSGKTRLSTSEFRKIAISSVQSALNGNADLNVESQASLDAVMSLLKSTSGISGRCSLVKGKTVERRFLDVSRVQKAVHCDQCGEAFTSKVKFCDVCGNDMLGADWAGATQILQVASAEVIVLKVSFLSDKETDNFGDEDIASAVISALSSDIRKAAAADLNQISTLETWSLQLNKTIAPKYAGIISEFRIIDIQTAGQDWFFKTEANIAEELRKIDLQQRELAIDERAIDFQEAAFALALRSDSQLASQRRRALQLRAQSVEIDAQEKEIELDEHSLETRTELRREGIDHDAEGERLARDKEKFGREREFQRNIAKENRVDELEQSRNVKTDQIDQAQHEITLEKTVAKHDIELADMSGEALSRSRRRDVSDESFEAEEKLRLDAARKSQIGTIDEDLKDRESQRVQGSEDRANQRQIDKLKAMADMEANMAKQDHDFELAKVDSMKNMDAEQILLMQATQLVKAGGGDAAAEMVKALAQSKSEIAGSAVKDDLYKQLLQAKDEGAKMALEAQKAALDALIRSNEGIAKIAGAASTNAVEGYKEAAKVAQTTNEKSMDSMSKVATAAAGKKQTKDDYENPSTTSCKNPDCDHVAEGKFKPFCPKCGFKQNQ